jgi:predicted  nucleic acid-binding Zn-ribbon protein
MQNEKHRMKDFDSLLKTINTDIDSINNEVLAIFKTTNDMLDSFGKEHLEMSTGLIAELNKNLTERVEYTNTMLTGFHKKLSEISKENLKMAQKLRKDLDNGEVERFKDYNGILKGIHTSITSIRKEVKNIQKETTDMLGDLSQNRDQASAEWEKMQDTMAQIRKKGNTVSTEQAVKKIVKKEVKMKIPVKVKPIAESVPVSPFTMEEKVLEYITKHQDGVKISEMEEPLNETRMKLGFLAKNLLNDGKVQKRDNVYFPLNNN